MAGSSSTIALTAPMRRADPETAVDHEIGPAAIARRHQFLDGRIDRGVFAADAGAGEETKQRVARDIPGQRRRRRRGEIERKRDEEQFLAPDPVGQPAEAERAEHGAGEIGAVGEADIEIGELQRRAFLQRARQRAGQRDLQPIENPGDAEREHDAGVKAAPGEIIEPRRDVVSMMRSLSCGDRRSRGRAGLAVQDCARSAANPSDRTNDKTPRRRARPKVLIPNLRQTGMPATSDNAARPSGFPHAIGTGD